MSGSAEGELVWGLHGLLIVAATAILTAGLIVALRPILVRHALARPNARSSHREPTPQGGGIAVTIATIGIVAVFGFGFAPFRAEAATRLAPVLAATALIALVGGFDDIRSIGVTSRLLLQTIAIAIVVAALPADLRVLPQLSWWIERALLVLAGLWFVNLVNFMDGLDWMTVAEVVPLASGIVAVGILGALPPYAVLVGLALLGATIGFAPFNRPVAKLFLGDVGSLPIGLLTGWLLVLIAGSGHLAAAVLLPLYYLADATLTLLRRLKAHERIWHAHRTHFYQRATDRGLTVMEVVGRVFATNLALALLATITVMAPSLAVSIASLATGAILVGWLLAGFARGRAGVRR